MDETFHLPVPENENTCVFTAETLGAGYTVRNLVTLQALDVLLRELELLEETEARD